MKYSGYLRDLIGVGVWLVLALPLVAAPAIVPAPQAFLQEVALRFTAADGAPTGAVQLIECPAPGQPRALSAGQWYEWRGGKWTVNAALRQTDDTHFVLADNSNQPVQVSLPRRSVLQVMRTAASIWVVGTNAVWQLTPAQPPAALPWPSGQRIRQLAVARDGRVMVASSAGLFALTHGQLEHRHIMDASGRDWTAGEVLGVAFDVQDRLWFATRAGVGCEAATNATFYEGQDGLPGNAFMSVAAAPDGSVWFTTERGVIRYDGTNWQYRQGLRWLPDDMVVSAAMDATNTVWFATAAGVGGLERKPMTLAAKAEYYEQQIEQYVKRTPYGYVAGAHLQKAGDPASADPQDTDNDGLWTAMYGAGECFAYAATGDARAKARAQKAFEALRFLQKVTQGGPHAPPLGFVARTIRSTTLPDPNTGRLEDDREHQRSDPQWKVYEPRWPKSTDGQWYWKSDTSSDELDGHYFFYALYYEFCADTAAEKDRVREVVRNLTDHLLTHHYQLVDHDGTHTRWGVFDPASLNEDPRWWPERGLNSLSLLSYLTVASYVTGDAKYEAAVQELVGKNGYAQNAMYPKVQFGIGSGNQSDDEMAFMNYYTLLRHTPDATLRQQMWLSFSLYWLGETPELSPFFNFAYAGTALNQPGSIVPGSPVSALMLYPDWQKDALATLHGFPLDQVNWGLQNSHRLDIVRLPLLNSGDLTDPDAPGSRGLCANGKVLPIENRYLDQWATDPWQLDYPGDGHELAAGTVFLLPYYLGLYHGFIAKPK